MAKKVLQYQQVKEQLTVKNLKVLASEEVTVVYG